MPDEFSEDELRALKRTAQSALGGPTRRDALAALGLAGSGALLGATAAGRIGTAAADPSTTDNDADVGQPSNRVDVFADGIDATSIAYGTQYQAVDDLGTTSGATALDLSAANMATVTLSGDVTFSFASASSSPPGNSLLLKITQDGATQYTISWPSSVNWIGGGAPPDPATGAELEVFFETYDGGSTWYGGEAGRYP